MTSRATKEFVRVGEVNLDWTVGGEHIQRRNFGLFTADVQVNVLCKEIESPGSG